MEKDPPSKPSVAELAGRFKGHAIPMPNSHDESPFRRPPCSLKLQKPKDDNEESDKPNVSPKPFKIKTRNSAIIEKLQANLSLSPTSLLPSPKSPEAKQQPAPPSPVAPCSPMSPISPVSPVSPRSPGLHPALQSSEEEEPVSFQNPPEGNTLPSINKTRPRLSFKRRPPSRQHRRSAGDEGGALDLSSCEQYSPKENGDRDQVSDDPAEEAESREDNSVKDTEEAQERDCEQMEEEGAEGEEGENAPDSRGRQEKEQAAEEGRASSGPEEDGQLSESHPAEGKEGDGKTGEE
ncbi:capZ-interacting protein [Genypterus blacodes]|uniref:capZ-interacting protein n=1 Tax=Genypterus blacodes TaxID=154954 RepID=UPI003F76CA45